MKRALLSALAALAALAGCSKEPNETPTVVTSNTQITTIAEAKTYLARQLAGGVLVKSAVPLTDKYPGGWRIEFTGGSPASVDLMNGSDAVNGLTPNLVVRHNADGSTTLWVNNGEGLQQTRAAITGPITEDLDTAIPPKMDVRRDDDGVQTVWYNDLYNYPDEGWKNTGVKVLAGSGTGTEAEAGPILAVIDNEARGVTAVWLNDEAHTSYTFGKFSNVNRFNIMADNIRMREGETAQFRMIASSSDAWIPTGAGEWINRWELNDPAPVTRAGYVQPCNYCKIERILPSGAGQGEYIVTIRSLAANFNTMNSGDVHSLVLNTNTSLEPKLISSTRFVIGSELPSSSANCIIMRPGSTADINMAQLIKEYQDGFVSAPRIAEDDDVTARWVWSCSPGMMTPTGVLSDLEVITASGSGLNTEFRVTAGSANGNAVVAAVVTDANGDKRIVWSWHIWVTDYDPETDFLTYNSHTATRLEAPDAGKDHAFMDRNLGALTDEPGGSAAFGLFYQWGRKDPLPGNWAGGAVPTVYTLDAPGGTPMPTANPGMTAGIRYSIEHPGEHIAMPSSLTGIWSWNDLSMAEQANLWYSQTDVSNSISKSVYDPCPAGWRMPAKGVLEGYFPDSDPNTTITDDGFIGTPYGYIPYAGYLDYTGAVVSGYYTDEGGENEEFHRVARYGFYTSQFDIPFWYSEWSGGKRLETAAGSQTSRVGSNAYSVRCIRDNVN